MKTCNTCNDTKELDLFVPDKKRKDGRRAICRSCHNAAARNRSKSANMERVRRYAQSNPERIAYNAQKQNAKKRNVPFLFGFEQWVSWWGEDFERRGRGPDDLVMARIGDEGPYCWHNVKKLTASENSMEARQND